MLFNEFVNAFLNVGDYLMYSEDEQDLCDFDVEFPDSITFTGSEIVSPDFLKLEVDKDNGKVKVRLNAAHKG